MPFDKDTMVNWNEISTFNVYTEHNFIVCLNKLSDAEKCKEAGIKFYYGFPINSFYELNLLKKLGVCYVRLAPPLSFKLDKIIRSGIPIRAIPNTANDFPWPEEDGVCGDWIRPEDIEQYDRYIEVMEFEDCDLKKEQALYRIYAEDKKWPGKVSMLISNIKTDATNRLIHPDFALMRMTCGQRCQEDNHCRYCHKALEIANEELITQVKKYRDSQAE